MSQRIMIGTIERAFGVATMLEQIGAPIERLEWSRLTPETYSAVVVDRTLDPGEVEALEAYASAGGALLDLGPFARARHLPSRFSRAGTVTADPGGPFRSTWLLDVDTTVRAPAVGEHLNGIASLERHGHGWLARLPLPVDRTARSHNVARRRFVAPTGPLPDELVARRPINEFRKAMEAALIWLHQQRGLPFVQRWRFPGHSPSVFCFRIDTDFASVAELETLRSVCEAHDVAATWFLHVGAHESDIDLFRRYDRHELALHGFRHRAFDDYEASWGNVREALAVVRTIGADPVGFAAPTGRWSRGLDRALSDQGMLYSSEFTLDYDGLPFRPWSAAAPSDVLQVPAHPVSIDTIHRAGGSDRDAVAYFDFVLGRKLAHSEPVIFYHHPSSAPTGPLEEILRNVRISGLPMMTMRDLATWWIARESSTVDASLDDGSLRIDARLDREDIAVRVLRPDNRAQFVDGSTMVDVAGDGWTEPVSRPFVAPESTASARRWTLRSARHSIEDLYSRMRQ